MPTNPFFNNYMSLNEQLLVQRLSIEAIQMYGIDCYYITRQLQNYDGIYGEDPISTFGTGYVVEMYVKNVEGFGGDGDFLSKFNIQIRDTMTLTVARLRWGEAVGNNTNAIRPLEGDLIYFPLNQKTFQIKFVEHESIFYQMGALQVWDLKCELWEYSNERLYTGIPELDILTEKYSFDMSQFCFLTEDGEYVIDTEDGYDLIQEQFNFEEQVGAAFENNDQISNEANSFIDFSETNPFTEI
jgi:hypothetical protein